MQAFGELPVVYQGRVKPFDTLARNSLIIISDRQTWRDADGERRPAIEWLLDVMSNAPRPRHHQVFRIHNDAAPQRSSASSAARATAMRWTSSRRRCPTSSGRRCTRAGSSPSERDVYDNKVLEFYQRVLLYRVLGETHLIPGLTADGPADPANAAMRSDMLEQLLAPACDPAARRERGVAADAASRLDGATRRRIAGPGRRSTLRGMLHAWAHGDRDAFNAGLDGRTRRYLGDARRSRARRRSTSRSSSTISRRSTAARSCTCSRSCSAASRGSAGRRRFRRIAFSLLADDVRRAHAGDRGARVHLRATRRSRTSTARPSSSAGAACCSGLFLEWIYTARHRQPARGHRSAS